MNTEIVKNNNSLIPNLKIRKDILDFESELSKVPGAVFGDSDLCPLKHSFSDGIYVREMSVPKGVVLTGKIHKHEHPYFVLKGKVTIVTEYEGKKVINAPCSIISKAGTKRVIVANEDSILITVHHNPDNIKDLKKLQDLIVSDNFLDYENYLNQKTINTNTTNCGLEALKKLSSIKSISMRTLIDMAEDNGVKFYPCAIVDGEQLMSIPLPAIVHSENHFDYISKKEDFDFNKEYTGYVLLTKKLDYKKIKSSELKNICGQTYVLVGIQAAGIVKDAIKIGMNSATDCGKECRALCKSKTGFLFSGRTECKQKCKSECLTRLTPEELEIERQESERKRKERNTIYAIAGLLFVIALGIALYVTLKKK